MDPPDANPSHSPDAVPPDPPDWDHITEEIRCPLCDYNLRGLTRPRCPECGYSFDWPEILDPTRRIHRYLYEHHPEREFRSFAQTFLGSLRAIRFWKSLHAAQLVNRSRLLSYWRIMLLGAVLALCITILTTSIVGMNRVIDVRAQQRKWLKSAVYTPGYDPIHDEYGSIDAYLISQFPTPTITTVVREYIDWTGMIVLGTILAWPWLTTLTMMIFRVSMRRARINMLHVLRCGIYSLTLSVWPVLLMVSIVAFNRATFGRAGMGLDRFLAILSCVILGCLIWDVFRLWMAFRFYLRFPHAFATVFSIQLIILLFTMNVVMLYQFN